MVRLGDGINGGHNDCSEFENLSLTLPGQPHLIEFEIKLKKV